VFGIKSLNYNKERVAEAYDLRLRWYKGEKTERIPFTFTVMPEKTTGMVAPGNPYNFKEMCEDTKKAVDGIISSMQYQFDNFSDCDYLPVMNTSYLGQGILAAIYGSEQVLDENYPPFSNRRYFNDIYEAAELSNDFDFAETKWGRILKEHIECFVDSTSGQIPVGVADYQSPYGTATKLMPNEELMLAMYDEPELVHKFFEKVTEGIIKLVRAMESWVGAENIAHNVSNPIPGECGLSLWDDYISVITPDLHMEFCRPCNIKLFEIFGKGHLHTCGPYFPKYIDACIACSPRSMDTGIMRGFGKTKEDMLEFLRIAGENDILIFGSLDTNDVHIFNDEWKKPEPSFVEEFIKGGYMPSGAGTYEEGLAFCDMITNINNKLN